ncbi:methylated-DNA-[protein]-cysteine S-methyltransferase [Marinactinospora thermotolerans DSM 45154]|uniref:Methylated-DNA--protein-cysteine methyltransferase n=1 Tax=Marinactinospora thermotolerans DSM 45154 TaxID=1122192 RepID=A0A1T4NHB6_9ACTN|nr:methylated-DNA--[protein]-cysteine S-methyltransferase [Marinactinospora thermotolerans]SJZ78624.1 methylated-DNA-[protein]-cysteine S-methyltransferase [Marinactinospora thermotolerans DSM 45154]
MTTADRTTGRAHTVLDSPVGPLTLVAEDGALTGLYMERQRHRPADTLFGERVEGEAVPVLSAAAEQLAAYFAGERRGFDLPLQPRGTVFQRRVWAALRDIPYGTTLTYGRLAEEIGSPGASRAVGLANGKNPIGIVIPCHRVVGSGGSLTGYGGGLERKRFLLDLEGAGVPALAPAGVDTLF